MAANLILKSDIVFVPCRFVEDIYTMTLFVGFFEITSFHNIDAHKLKKVPRDGINLIADIFTTKCASPTHTSITYERP